MNRHVMIIVALFSIGLLVGWFGHKNTRPDIHQTEKRENTNASVNNVQANPVRALEKEQSNSLSSAPPESSYEGNAPSIMKYLALRSQDEAYSGAEERELRNLVHRTPGLAYELLEQLILLEDGVIKENLIKLLFRLQVIKQANLDKWIIEKIRLEQQSSKWLQVLARLGVQSADSVLFLNDRLPNLTDSADIKATISALGDHGLADIYIPPAERLKLISNIKPHLDSNDESVRAAAIASLHSYPSEDLELQVLKALEDGSRAVRSNAMMVFVNLAPQSNAIKTQAIANLQNSSLHPIERRSIASITSQLQLDASERAIVEQANSEIETALSELSEDDFIEYSRQAQANR